MISYLIGSDSEAEKNPLLKYRSAFDWVAAYISLLLVMVLVAAFRNGQLESSAASNWLLAIMTIYLVGEVLSRVYVPFKLAALLLYGIAIFTYLWFSLGTAVLLYIVNLGFEKFVVASAISIPFVFYFFKQKGTYHHRAAMVGCGLFTFLTWLAILMARGHWQKIDPSGQLLYYALFAISIAILMVPRIVESIFLCVGWPVGTATHIAIKESNGNFEHVVNTLSVFLSVGVTIVVVAVVLVVTWRKVGPGSIAE